MEPQAEYMVDHWHNRAERLPDEGVVYWHILMRDHPEVLNIARDAQQRLADFTGLHMTPIERLHLTALMLGPATHFSENQLQQMIEVAAVRLANTLPITVTTGEVIYHPEAIMLAVEPHQALATMRDALHAAAYAVTGRGDTDARRWVPHITVSYSTADQPVAPIKAALGYQLRRCRFRVSAVSLVVQRGSEKLWDWRIVDTIRLPPGAG
jgi:2'-5' RNA ligase